jgi:hypothetical protein
MGSIEYPYSKEVSYMKLILTVFVVTVFLAGVMATASAADALDLSTLGKEASMPAISLPQVSQNMPSVAPTALALGGNVEKAVLDLSTLGKKADINPNATMIRGPGAVTVTPMFAIKNPNAANQAGSVRTLPLAISASTSVNTPSIALFGGA